MESNLETWKKLYETTKIWSTKKPWLSLESNDWIQIEFDDMESIYCTIMGSLGECIGLSIYQGDAGLADLISISREYDDIDLSTYMMFDQNCITLYMGNRDEVPKHQKNIIKQLGLRYRGNGNWPYFLSFKKGFMPFDIDDNQAALLIKVMEKLLEIVPYYQKGKIDVEFEENEMIYAHIENNQWQYEAICIPDIDKFVAVIPENEKLMNKLKATSYNDNELIIDINYAAGFVTDPDYSQPINPLLVIVFDKKSEMIVFQEMLKPDDDEIQLALDFLVSYILQYGRPRTIYFKNPIVWCALSELCIQCKIALKISKLPLVDEYFETIRNIL